MSILEHDRLSIQDMSLVVQFLFTLASLGAQLHMLTCFFQRSISRYGVSCWTRDREACERRTSAGVWEPADQTTTVFKVEGKASNCKRAPNIYNNYLRVKQLQYMFVADCSIQFWRKRLPATGMFSLVYCRGVHNVVNAHAGLANVVSNVPLLSVETGFMAKTCQKMVEVRWCYLSRIAWYWWRMLCTSFSSLFRWVWTHMQPSFLQWTWAYFWTAIGGGSSGVTRVLLACRCRFQILWWCMRVNFWTTRWIWLVTRNWKIPRLCI